MRPYLGPLSRSEVARWDAIDWVASTTELGSRVTVAVRQLHPEMRVDAGYRRLDGDRVAFVVHGTHVDPAAAADTTQLAADIERIAGEVFAGRGWIAYREAGQVH